MGSKVLSINKDTDITSFVQHSYTNAIVSNKKIVSMYINRIKNCCWSFEKTDINYYMDNKNNTIVLEDKTDRESNLFKMKRSCAEIDETVIQLHDIKIIDPLTYIKLSFARKNEIGEYEDDIFFVKWNQYNINVDEQLTKRERHMDYFYRLKRNGNTLTASISFDENQWEILGEKKFAIDEREELHFNLQVYYGNNQYEAWKYMNYIQLFYNPYDLNTVYLDYYMFPRKGVDASYNYMCNFLNTEYVSIQEHLAVYKNVVSYLKNSIDNGYYINLALDEYGIKTKGAYDKYHNCHFNLFYGYDDEQQAFLILGYDMFGKINTTYVLYSYLQNTTYANDIIRYKYCVNQVEIKFSIGAIIQSIKEYIYGIDSSIKYMNMLASRSGCYGLKIFDELRFTEKGRWLLINDKRISYILYEHCLIMKNRLTYLDKLGYLCNKHKNKLNDKMEKMLRAAEKLKNLVVMHIFSENKENSILESCETLYNSEMEFYNLFLESISNV